MRRNKKNIAVLCFVFFLAIGGGFFVSSQPAVSAKAIANYQIGELLIKFKNNGAVDRIKVSPDTDIFGVIKKYQSMPEVEYIEPNYTVKATAFPNDPDFSLQWYFGPINARSFWSDELLAREQNHIVKQSVIAILDTGVFIDHPDLKDKIWLNKNERASDGVDNDSNGYVDDIHGWNFVNNNNDPNPTYDSGFNEDAVKHGTIVAGIAAASSNNNLGITGMSWFAQVMPLRVLDSAGAGDVYSVVKAIDYAINNGADVINMSFVGTGYSQSLYDAIHRAYNKNVLVVAAAGNTDPAMNGEDMDINKSYPVCYDGVNGENMVIGVASVAKNLTKSLFSNYGDCVDLSAPGEEFYSTQAYRPDLPAFSDYYDGYWSGTSLSAPLVSGTLATLKALKPNFNADEINNFVLKNTDDIYKYNPSYAGKLGTGLLDAGNAIAAALGTAEPVNQTAVNSYIIAGLGSGSFPQVKVFKTDGTVFKQFFAYDPLFKGTINVAAGDVTGDGVSEIVTAPGSGGGPHIRIFNINGQVISQFFAYDKNFHGGANVAVGDINGDGRDEIITAPGKGIAPEVRIFDYQGNLLNSFLAYGQAFVGGVKVAVADVNRDGKKEIVTGAGPGGGPHVRIFSGNGELISQFFAYNENFHGGINIAAGDVHGDTQADIIVSVESNSLPTVRVFTYTGSMSQNFFAYDPNYILGINVAVGDINSDGIGEIITGPSANGNSEIRVFDQSGILKSHFAAHVQSYKGGVRVGVIRY